MSFFSRITVGPRLGPVIFGIVALCCVSSLRAERSVTLAWYPSPDTSTVGYRVYMAEEGASAVVSSNVFNVTQVTWPGLKEGLRYTFTVTAYNAAGLESPPSNEASFVVPVPLQLLSAPNRVVFPVAPGRGYELQISSDLRTWTTIWQTNNISAYAWTKYLDPISPGTGPTQRFYRLQIR